jgi:hypothetical protein
VSLRAVQAWVKKSDLARQARLSAEKGGRVASESDDDSVPYPDPVVFTDVQVVVTVHVDDRASTGDDAAVAVYRERLHKRIEEYYGLDVEVDRARRRTRLCAQSYIERMLVKLGVAKVPVTQTPLPVDLVLQKMVGPSTDKKLHVRYREVTVGACCTQQ